MARRKSTAFAWPVVLKKAEEGGFVINFPDFPEGYTQGGTREEALAQAADLLETMVANYMAEDWTIPSPSPARGRLLVSLAPPVAAAVELYRAMCEAGVSKTELARRIGIAPQKAGSLFDIRHPLGLDQLAAAAAALGKRLVVALADAA
jgi:antitoxin HicB